MAENRADQIDGVGFVEMFFEQGIERTRDEFAIAQIAQRGGGVAGE